MHGKYRNIHAGEDAAILGGGPSLPDELKKVPDGTVLFGINHHASRIVTCDYIVFNDYKGGELTKDLPGKKICRFRDYADIYENYPEGVISGVCALRAAQFMGFGNILLAGFDCYQSPGYFYNNDHNRGHDLPLKTHLEYWKHEKRDGVTALGGPLKQIFGKTRPETIMKKPSIVEVNIHTAKTVQLDDRRSTNFVIGKQKLPRELAEAAEKAGITTKFNGVKKNG